MSSIGPDLPPHLLAKRKRRQEDVGPASTPSAQPSTATEDVLEKRRKVIGPAMPPAPMDERPTEPLDDGDSSSDDDFGPSIATDADGKHGIEDTTKVSEDTATRDAPARAIRDEWMTMAPTQDGLAARLDPSRQRARGFNTGRAARGATSGGDAAAWHETAEQKQKRLADEVLGITAQSVKPHASNSASQAATKKARNQPEPKRGPSLLEQHRDQKPEQAEDDPSKRAFDYEKDMGIGISSASKRDLLGKASGYSSRFSGGSYL